MPFATIKTRTLVGMRAASVTVETYLARGLPSFTIVGLPETAVRESKDRVRSALAACGFEMPIKKITVNLAPADLPKQGSHFDLPIALSILAASEQLPIPALSQYEFLGELSLSGELRSASRMLAIALACQSVGQTLLMSEPPNGAALISNTKIMTAKHFNEVIAHFSQGKVLNTLTDSLPDPHIDAEHDLVNVKGQAQAKRALIVAASGGHSLLMSGPPGTGKTMLASHLPSILPPMQKAEAVDNNILRLLHHEAFSLNDFWRRPFRAPHHSASHIALVGGGNPPRPGEVSLAHAGVLFLDELPEFSRVTINALRQPIEAGRITIARAAHSVDFPARFQLIAAMNPCPCGYHGDPEHACRCTPQQIQQYVAKISGPILDRIDMKIIVPRIKPTALNQAPKSTEHSADIREHVLRVREMQYQRQQCVNAQLSSETLTQFAPLSDAAQKTLDQAAETMTLSIRAYQRVIKVARTLADMAGAELIEKAQVLEALAYRV